MLFYLMISIMVLFTLYHFYVDIKGKLNTGNGFAEGMKNQSEALSGNGADYRGNQNKTRNGHTCQKWTSQSPHNHDNTPETKPNKGLGDHNYCRNPDGHSNIWCYTTDPNKRWGDCDPLPEPALQENQISEKVNYEMLTDISDFCADGSNKTTKMEWTGEVCEGDKIKWNSMKSLAGTTRADQPNGCEWNRDADYATETWVTKYIGSCGVSPTIDGVSLPTTLTELPDTKPTIQPVQQTNVAESSVTESGENINQTNAPVVNNIAAPNQPVWQDQQMVQQHSNQQNTSNQNVANPNIANQNGNYVMSNNNVIIKGDGECPNGCRPPAYDSNNCQNEILNGKEYRRCQWINDSNKDQSCNGCGAILLPKNKYGYAKTRPKLFNDITVDTVAKNVIESNNDGNKQQNYLKVGTDFMNDLARVKNFTLPTITNSELKEIGKLVYAYEMDRNESGEGKLYLTNLINNTLNSQYLPTRNGVLKKNTRRPRGNEVEDRMDSDDIMSNYYNQQETASDNRLGGSKTAYKQNYRPVDPRKRPNPYDSIWHVFSK